MISLLVSFRINMFVQYLIDNISMRKSVQYDSYLFFVNLRDKLLIFQSFKLYKI